MTGGGDESGPLLPHLAAAQQEPLGSLAARIANATVHLISEYTGRGPTRAKAYVNDELVTVVLRDTLTRGERSLVADGQSELVLNTRKAFQMTMRSDLTRAVETLTGQPVIAFLSDNHIDPDVAIEAFVLGPPA
jgi:uncharacterized protein YbcI